MNGQLYSRLAGEVVFDWVATELSVDSESTPNNGLVYSQFSTGARRVFGQDDGEERWNFDPKFVTKSTLHRLYREITRLQEKQAYVIDALDSGSLSAELSIPDSAAGEEIDGEEFQEHVVQLVDTGLPEDFANSLFGVYLANRALPYLTISQALIEEYSIEILNEELFTGHYRDSNNSIEFLEKELSQPNREQLLQRTGLLEGGIIGQMSTVRQTRNDLVHELRSDEYFTEVVESISVMDDVVDVIRTFEQHFGEHELSWE